MDSLRFYLDENVPVQVARQLKTRGIDVITVHDLGLLGEDDISHLQKAIEQDRVLCTYDFASKSMAEPWHLSVGYIILLKKSNPLVQRKDDEIEQLMQTIGQLKSDFTNFISVLLDASSHRLAL